MSRARYLETSVINDLKRKMVFLGGPRQVGKTTFARSLLRKHPDRYLNFDDDEDRDKILRRQWPQGEGLIVLDELHKFHRWRNTVKGLFDKRKNEIQILVTGSARLDYYRKGGDSLQGRYYYYRMHPFSVAELGLASQKDFSDLLNLSGFPEPFLGGSEKEKRRWSIMHRSRLIREDIRDLERIDEASALELLVTRLPQLVGSPLSINALREDLNKSHRTVSRWCEILERMYFIFRIYPFGAPKLRAVKKEAKHYHYDWSLPEDVGARFENLVASHILKWRDYQLDVEGRELELRYFRDVDGREVDFVVVEKGEPRWCVECKSSRREISKSLRYLKARFPQMQATQLVYEPGVSYSDQDGIRVESALTFLMRLV